MPNSSFSTKFIAVLSTVGLVASAMTGLLYSSPVQAYTSTTTPSTTEDVMTSNKVQPVFKFTLSSSEIKNPLKLSFKTTSENSAILKTGVVAPTTATTISSSDCKVTVSYTRTDNTAGSKVFNDCAVLTNPATGNYGVTSSSQDITDVKADSEITVSFDTKVLSEPANTDVDVQFVARLVNNDLSEFIGSPARYNLKLGGLEIVKTRESSVNSTTFIGATAPTNVDALFKIEVTNKNSFAINSIQIKDYLNSSAKSYYNACSFGTPSVYNGTAWAAGTVTSTPASGQEITGTFPTLPAKANSADGKIVVYVGCKRTSSSTLTGMVNFAKIKAGLVSTTLASITDSSISSYDFSDSSSDLRAQANFAGNADLSIKKEVVTNGLGSNTTGDVTYRVTVKNENASNASDKVLLTDFVQTPGGVSDSAVLKGTALVNQDSDIDGSPIGSVMPDVKTAYSDGRNVKNYGIYFSIDKMSPSQSIQYTYTIAYNISSSECLIDQPARLIRNSALLSPMPSTYAIGGSVTLNGTNIEDVVIAGAGLYADTNTKVIDYDTTSTSVTVDNSYLFTDPNQNNNMDKADITSDLCKPDMMLVSKAKSTTPTSIALIGTEVEYTVIYKNYAAKTAGANPQIRSGAKNIILQDVLATGVSFVKVVSPAGAEGSLSGNNLTISKLPDLKLGDDSEQTVKYVVKMPAGVANAGKEIKNIVSVKVNNEMGGYEFFKEDLGTVLNSAGSASGTSSNFSTTDSRGNNSFKNTITLQGGPDVQVMKTVDIGEGALKPTTTSLTYTIKVKNVGTETANAVMVRDTLPTCTTFDSKVSGPDGTLTTDQRNIDYNLGNLNVDQEVVAVFKVKIIQNDACKINNSTVIQNSATATISSSQKDLNVSNNTGIANSTVVDINADAPLTKTVDQIVAQPGATLTYTITLKAVNTKFEGTLVDTLPTGVTFVSADPTAVRDGAKLTWSNVVVESGKQLVATVKVTVDANTTGTVANSVTATNKAGKISPSNLAITSIEVAGSAKVTGYIYFDANKNKKEDKLERGATYADFLGNIAVVAVASNGKTYSAVTDKTGAFMIDKLPAGKYTVKVDINTVKATFKNIAINVSATDPSADGLTKIADVRANESFDLVAGFRLFTNQTSTGATSNGGTTVTGIIAMLSFSFLATLAYAEARKRALSL